MGMVTHKASATATATIAVARVEAQKRFERIVSAAVQHRINTYNRCYFLVIDRLCSAAQLSVDFQSNISVY
jgi:hypothetical protein